MYRSRAAQSARRCVGGPSKHKTEMEIKKAREGLLKQADGRKVLENLKAYPMDKFSMYRDGHMDETCKVEING